MVEHALPVTPRKWIQTAITGAGDNCHESGLRLAPMVFDACLMSSEEERQQVAAISTVLKTPFANQIERRDWLGSR